MNESEAQSPAPEQQEDMIASLRHQMTLILLALIVVSGTLTTYLFYQSRILGRELAAMEPEARLMVENYNKNLPHIQKFVQALVAYGQKHPDYQPILKKYGIPLTLPAATNSTSQPGKPTIAQPKK